MNRSRTSSSEALLIVLIAAVALVACSSGSDDETGNLESSITGVPAPGDPPAPPSLKTVKVPEPENLGDFVANRGIAIALGKALFWDMQIGGDGIMACASCHFNAGADSRSKNQLNPGFARTDVGGSSNRDTTFQLGGANYQLRREDFPLHRLQNPDDRNSRVLFDTNDVVSSQGVTLGRFIETEAGEIKDIARPEADPDGFRVGGINVRRTVARNAPTVINAVFNDRQFWDGHAQNEFNGVNSLGSRDANATLFRAALTGAGDLTPTKVLLRNSSLASQALEPPVSDIEMASIGRTWPDIGDKLGAPDDAYFARRHGRPHRGGGCNVPSKPRALALRPLARQLVHPCDSVLGSMSRAPKRGLEVDSYAELIERAFRRQWWQSRKLIEVDASGTRRVVDKPSGAPGTEAFTLMEYNFSLFFGLAVQMYEATLVADDTPFDRFREGQTNAMTAEAKLGLDLFLSQSRGRCVNCHEGAELTGASVSRVAQSPLRRREGNILDRGFNNIGVRPTLEDLGVGGAGLLGFPLSTARLAFLGQFTDPTLAPPLNPSVDILGVDGAMKVPGLRNVELTAPYFHNGGTRTLREVVDFYSRGGDFQPITTRDGRPISPLNTLNNTEEERRAFVAFLRSLTDERVRYARAPFDHPQLFVPNGHPGDSQRVQSDSVGNAVDQFLEIRAVGRDGGKPLPGFLD